MTSPFFLFLLLPTVVVNALGLHSSFVIPNTITNNNIQHAKLPTRTATWGRMNVRKKSSFLSMSDDNNNNSGKVSKIRGCSIKQVEGKLTEFEITIDGEQADLGRFSKTIYQKITSDAKQQQFQGFRPGTIPPHIQPTYIAFAMDECAREATLEAMNQNGIRPFQDARDEFLIERVSIPPPVVKKKKRKKKKKKKKVVEEERMVDEEEKKKEKEEVVEQWLMFDSMKEAIKAGWKPGQSFSFVATNVKGQELKDQDVSKATAIGSPDAVPPGGVIDI